MPGSAVTATAAVTAAVARGATLATGAEIAEFTGEFGIEDLVKAHRLDVAARRGIVIPTAGFTTFAWGLGCSVRVAR